MTRPELHVRRVDTREIYRAKNANTFRRLLRQKQTLRYKLGSVVSEEKRSVSRIMPETMQNEKHVNEWLQDLIEKLENKWLQDLIEALRLIMSMGDSSEFSELPISEMEEDAIRSLIISCRKASLLAGRRPWYKRQTNLKSRFSEKGVALWYLERTPNDRKICRTLIIAA